MRKNTGILQKKKAAGSFRLRTLLAWSAIGFLALVDFYNVLATLAQPAADIPLSSVRWYAFSLCFALEGFPTILGFNLSRLTDKTRHRANDKTGAIIGTAVSGAAMLLVFYIFWTVKTAEILQQGGSEAFLAGAFPGYMVQLLLRVLPVITSMMAFVISWSYFSAESKTELERQTRQAFAAAAAAQQRLDETVEQLECARIRLWVSVSGTEKMPATLETFRTQVCLRIRNLTVESVIAAFPLLLTTLDKQLETRLQQAIHTMAAHSSTPLAIEAIDLKQALAQYDANQTCGSMVWAEQCSEKALAEALKYSIDNAVVVAHSGPVRG